MKKLNILISDTESLIIFGVIYVVLLIAAIVNGTSIEITREDLDRMIVGDVPGYTGDDDDD